jgi:hypothetical protein
VPGKTLDDFEFLVADGGSADDSLELIRRHPLINLHAAARRNRLGHLPHSVPCIAHFGRTRARQLLDVKINLGWLAHAWRELRCASRRCTEDDLRVLPRRGSA